MSTEKVRLRELQEGDVTLTMVWADGMGLPQFAGIIQDGPDKRLEDIRSLKTRKDDIILAAFPKSGTHWTWEIINMLVRGKADYHKENKVSLMIEALPSLALIESEPSPRVINTHLPYRWLPKMHVENGGKIVHVRRNPKDASVSFYHHFKTSSQVARGATNMTWDQFFNIIVMGELNVYGGWFAYEKEMEEARKKDKGNCLHSFQYEQLHMDPHKEIKRLADFLSVPYTDQLISDIVEKCSFNNLKDVQKTVPESIRAHLEKLKSKDGEKKTFPVIYRKGVVGDWKNYFTVAQNERFEERFKRETKECDMDIIYELQQKS